MEVQSRSSSRRVFRWKCSEVELIAVPIETNEYAERLARIAEELYSLMNQLHNRSNSVIHPGETLEPKPVAVAMEYEGACNGKEPIQKAA